MLARSLPLGWHETVFGPQGSRNEPSLATLSGRGSIPTDMCFSKWVGQNSEYPLKHDSWESKSTYSGDLKYRAPGTFDYHCLVLKVLGKLQWFPVTNSLTKGPFNRMDSEVVPLCNFLGFRHHHQLEGAGSYIYCTLGFCQSYFKKWHHLTFQVCFGWCSLQFSHCLKARF